MSANATAQKPIKARLQIAGLLVLVLAAIITGYFGFRSFVTLPDLSVFNLYVLAVGAGIASFFSPCAFPLLPTYFSFYYMNTQEVAPAQPERGKAIRLGLATALGVVTFNLVLGVLIGSLGAGAAQGLSISDSTPNQFVQIFRGGVGVVLLILGAGQLWGWNLKPRFVDAFAYRTRPESEGKRSASLNLYLYGLGYYAAGMGCTGPILAGLIVFALSAGGFTSAFIAFAVFSIVMGILMLALSLVVAASRETLITQLKAATPKIKTISSYLLILIGVFNLFTVFNLDFFLRTLFP